MRLTKSSMLKANQLDFMNFLFRIMIRVALCKTLPIAIRN